MERMHQSRFSNSGLEQDAISRFADESEDVTELERQRFVVVEDPRGAFRIEPPLSGWKIKPSDEVPEVSILPTAYRTDIIPGVCRFLIEERAIPPSQTGVVLRFSLFAFDEHVDGLAVRLSFLKSSDSAFAYFGVEQERGIELLDSIPRRTDGKLLFEMRSEDWTLQELVDSRSLPRGLQELAKVTDVRELSEPEMNILQSLRARDLEHFGVRTFGADPQDNPHYMAGELGRQVLSGIWNCGSNFGE